jgi:hypothetical protein
MADPTGPIISDGLNALNTSATTANENLAGLKTGLDALSDKVNEKIQGLHELGQKEALKVAIQSISPEMQTLYNTLSEFIPGIKSIEEILKTEEEAEKKAEDSHKDGDKKGKNQWSVSDIAKLAANFSGPALFLHTTIMDMGQMKSTYMGNMQKIFEAALKATGSDEKAEEEKAKKQQEFLDSLKAIIVVDSKGGGSNKEESSGPTKGPKLDFESGGWKELAQTLTMFATAADTIVNTSFLIATVKMKLIANFVEKTKEIFETAPDLGKVKDFQTFSKAISDSFKALTIAAVFAIILALLAKTAIKGMPNAQAFVKELHVLLHKPEDFKGQWLTKPVINQATNLALFSKQMALSLAYLAVAALCASLMVVIGTMATLGLKVANKFIIAAMEFVDSGDWTAKTKGMAGISVFASTLAAVMKNILVAMAIVVIAGLLAIIASVAVFGIIFFLLAFALVSIVAKALRPLTTEFLQTVVLIAIAMAFFAATLLLMQMIVPENLIKKTIFLVFNIAILLIGFALLGLLAFLITPALAAIFVAGLLIALAFLSLWVALIILNKLPISEKTIESLMKVVEFFHIISAQIFTFLLAALAAIVLVIASVLLMISFIVLIVAVFMLNILASILESMTGKVEGAPDGVTLLAVGLIAVFLLSFTLLFPIMGPVIIAAVLLVIVSVLLLVAFIALTITVALAIAVTLMIEGHALQLLAMPLKLTAFFASLSVLGVASLLVIIVAAPLLIAAVMLLAIFVALTVTIALAILVTKLSDKLDAPKIRDKIFELFDVVANKKLVIEALKIILVAAPVLAASVMLLGIFSAIAGTYVAIGKIAEVQDKVDPQPIFAAVDQLMDIVAAASESMKDKSILALAKFKLGIGAVTEAVATIVDVIIKLSDPNIIKQIPDATKNLRTIMDEFFGVEGTTPKPGSVMAVLQGVGSLSKGQLRAAEALVPLTEAISNITDVIIKVSTIKKEDIDIGIANLGSMGSFTDNISDFTDKKLPKANKLKDATKSLDALSLLLDSLTDVSTKASGLSEIKLNLQENIVAPLMELDPAIKSLKAVKDEIKGLNSELSKLTKDNKDTIKGISGIGQANSKGLSAFRTELASFAKKGKDSSSPTENKEDPMVSIAKDVHGIAQQLIKPPASWTDEGVKS